jgi:DNA topoisomerase-1
MSKNLVIVESPAKAKTIGRFLGRDYDVKASLGHVRDLPQGKMGIDVENDFEPQYVIPKTKSSLVKELNTALKGVSQVYLATDPDREGEAIAWHLTQAAKMEEKPVFRVVFHEITKSAIEEAFRHPREIDADLVSAQQTRRLLDRLVGYRLSPLLWKKVRGGLSAGRVQSAALRMVVDREREIEAFVPKEYWPIVAELEKKSTNGSKKRSLFKANLASLKGEKGKLEVGNKQQADGIRDDLEGASYVVASVTRKETQRKPTAPFITSTLQQEAWRKLRYSARRTMAVAQQLYEGLSVGAEGSLGLITYMRTDSPTVSTGAIQEARELIHNKYGAEFVPASPRSYKARAKGAQEAHEAIRPTSAMRTPEDVKPHLNADQHKLYRLVWNRMVASQMANAVFDSTRVDIESSGPASPRTYLFRANGLVQKFAGFLALYAEGTDSEEEDEDGALPPLTKDESLDFRGLDLQQKFTQPPARYSEATLVKAMEENGIGRPSTYAPIITTIQERGYAKKDGGTLKPEALGTIVTDLLRERFSNILDLNFTAKMEEGLDEIARGEKDWVPFLRDFYAPFDQAVQVATDTMERRDEPTDEVCEKCERPMVIKKGRFGLFLACTGYPECRNTKPHLTKVGVPCPVDGGEMVQKRSRKGKFFYGCANWKPNDEGCDFAMPLRPILEPCPQCGGLLGAFARGGVACSKCDYKGKRPRVKRDDEEQEAEPVAAAG